MVQLAQTTESNCLKIKISIHESKMHCNLQMESHTFSRTTDKVIISQKGNLVSEFQETARCVLKHCFSFNEQQTHQVSSRVYARPLLIHYDTAFRILVENIQNVFQINYKTADAVKSLERLKRAETAENFRNSTYYNVFKHMAQTYAPASPSQHLYTYFSISLFLRK